MGAARPDDLDALDATLLDAFEALGGVEAATGGRRVPDHVVQRVFDSQLRSRHLDLTARWLRAEGVGFYTIGSAGHEANAWIAAAVRPTDPALLHYRSGGFYLSRAAQIGARGGADHDGVSDVLLGLLASVDEPIAGGRHKVFGHRRLAVIPQTSTIASHLPRALGVAFAIGRAGRLGLDTEWPSDAITVCSFGDASLNHSTA
ncbi:MAG: MFS transporter, partial [Ilumatobacteraceae bacterium]